MYKLRFFLSIISFILSFISAQIECGPNGTLSIAGSSTVEPIAKVWAEGYMTMCPGIVVNVAGGGSTAGARGVCNVTQPPIDIGNMSRQWRLNDEANVTDVAKKKYVCNFGTKTRTVTQIDVGIDGITIAAVNGGLASQCFRAMEGKGLTIDQLRWLFSNYSASQLISSGWDQNAVPFTDNTEFTHFWSEFTKSPSCPKLEIRLSSPGSLSGTFDFFREQVLPGIGEGLATNRPFGVFQSEIDEELVGFVESNYDEGYGNAISYFGFSYFVAEGTSLYGVPIRAKGATEYYFPNYDNIEAGVYKPFSRRIYMNVHDGSNAAAGPFISFGFSQEGIILIKALGFVPPPQTELPSILARIGRQPSPTSAPTLAPIRIPVKPPTPQPASSPENEKCGLLGLSIFCPFSFCGLFGRLIGLC
jgi:ABC-type phosphate transport system substrate-binding protein